MSGQTYPKDETLRLVLSREEEQWITERIQECRIFLWAMSLLLALSASWIAAHAAGAFSLEDEAECFSLSADNPDYREIQQRFLAMGLQQCPPEGYEGPVDSGITWKDVGGVATLLSLIVFLVSFLSLLRNLFLLRRYKGYFKDHQAFLRKYNRL